MLALLAVSVIAVIVLIVLWQVGFLDGWLSHASIVASRSIDSEAATAERSASAAVNRALCNAYICTSDADCRPPSDAGKFCDFGRCVNGVCEP